MSIKKVVILDDHPLFLTGLKTIIKHDPKLLVTDTCDSSAELFLSLSLSLADIVLLDCTRPEGEMDVHSLVECLYKKHPNLAIVLMGENNIHYLMSGKIRPKVHGYLCKSLIHEEFISGLHRIVRKMNADARKKAARLRQGDSLIREASVLSVKEKKILEYLYAGFSVTQTAQRVNRSVKTVSTQKRTAMRKLGIKQNRDIFQLNIHEL